MSIQNYFRYYQYIEDYWRMQFDLYSKHALSYLVTYWQINKEKTVWDKDIMQGGSYERIGNLSGMKYNRFLLLPIYFPDEINTSFNGSELGLVKDQETSIVIPSSYGITPYAGDILKLDQHYLQNDDTYPFFIVSNIEISPNTNRRYWKLKIKIWQMDKIEYILNQTEDTYVFFEYTKNILSLEDATRLAQLMSQNEELKNKIKNYYDENSGFIHS